MEQRIILSSDANFARAKDALKWCWNERAGELHVLEIKPYKKDRTTQQNRYYRGFVVRPLAQHCGYTEAEMHDELLGSYFGWKTIRGLSGREREVPSRRTTEPEKMSKEDFSKFIEHCHAVGAGMEFTFEPYDGWQE